LPIITGIISRSISGLNVMIIGAPLKILVGIIFLLIALPFILNGMKDMIKHLKDVIEGTLVYQQNMIMVLVNNLF
jgi:flagellar biosynthesis protein FliR